MKHSQKLKLSTRQNDILRILEEAGAEDLPCVLITLWSESDFEEPMQFLEQVEAEMLALIRLGLVTFYRSETNTPYLAMSQDEMMAALPLSRLVRFEPSAHSWVRVSDLSGDVLEGLMLTEAGAKEMQR